MLPSMTAARRCLWCGRGATRVPWLRGWLKTWDRARGWALSMGSALVAASDDSPEFLALGVEILIEVLTD